MIIQSSCNEELEFPSIGIHFPWMQNGSYYRLDLADNPARIPRSGNITFDPIGFNIASNAPIGPNDYEIRVEYKEHQQYGWDNNTSIISITGQIYVLDVSQKTYQNLIKSVQMDLINAQATNYESPSAKSLITQALNEFNLATSLSAQGEYSEALNHLQNSTSLIMQAPEKEEEYNTNIWKEKAQGAMYTANQKIDAVTNCEGPDSKSLLQKAHQMYTLSQNSYIEATIEGYQTAYNSANHAASYADQAKIAEEQYQKQKQINMIIAGATIIIVLGVAWRFFRTHRSID